MRAVSIAVGLVCLLAPTALAETPHTVPQSATVDFDRAMTQGVAALEAGDAATAIVHFRQALEHQPGHPAALALLGNALTRTDELARAIEALEQASRAAPTYYDAQLWRAQAYRAAGRLPEATSTLQICVSMAPEDPAARAQLTELLLRTGRLADALPHGRELTRLTPQSYVARYLLATIELQLGNGEEALVWYRAAERARPDEPRALYGQARALADLERPVEAMSILGRIIEMVPDHAGAWKLFADLLVNTGRDLDAAVTAADFYQQALDLRPRDRQISLALAELYLRLALHPEGIQVIRALGSTIDDDPGAQILLGRLLTRQREYTAAGDAYRRAIDTGGGATAWYYLGVVHVNLSDLEAAADAFGTAATERPDFGEAYRDLGMVLIDRNEIEGARAALSTAVRLRPDDAEAHYLAGMAAIRASDLDTAVSELRRARELNPADDRALYNLAVAWRGKGDTQRSQELLEQMLQLRSSRNPGSATEVRNTTGEVLLRAGMIRYRLGSYERASATLEQAAEVAPGNALAQLYLGLSRTELGRLEEAVTALETAAHLAPERAEIFAALAQAYRLLGRDEDARRAEDRARALGSEPQAPGRRP